MSNNKRYEITYKTITPKLNLVGESTPENFRIELPLIVQTITSVTIHSTFLNPFIQATIQGNADPCVCWIESIVNGSIRVSCKSESSIQCIGVLYVTVTDASTIPTMEKSN